MLLPGRDDASLWGRNVEAAFEDLFARYPYARKLGRVTDPSEFAALHPKVQKLIPDWYKRLMMNYPIAGLPIGIPFDFGWESLKGRAVENLPLTEIVFHDVAKIAESSTKYFPGYRLINYGYISIAKQNEGSEDEVFIRSKDPNPKPIIVFHEAGDSKQQLLSDAWKPSGSFCDFIKLAKIPNFHIELTESNRETALKLIEKLRQDIESEVRSQVGVSLPSGWNQSTFEERMLQSRSNWPSQPLRALNYLEWALTDSGYPVTRSHLDRLVEIYEIAGLHLPELLHWEEALAQKGT